MKNLIRKFTTVFAICLSILLLCKQVEAVDFLCLHYGDDALTPETCQFLADKFDFDSELYTEYTGEKYTVIWLAGFGTPDGFWADSKGNNRISWETLIAKYKADILIIDACYSGRIFDYNIPENMVVISSTNRCSVSVNTVEKWTNGKYIPTLASMFYCLLGDADCKEYIGCDRENFDPQVCQMSMIFDSCAKRGFIMLKTIRDYPDYHPNFSIGTVLINGEPWRKLEK